MKSYSFKNLLFASLLVIPSFLMTSCDDSRVLRGHGDTVPRTRPVADFKALDVQGNFEVYLTQGPTQDILFEGQDNVISEIKTRVRNNELKIEYDRWRVKVKTPVRIYLTTPDLNKIEVSGSNSVRGLSDWNLDGLDLTTSGSGNIYLTVKNANTVETRISGSGDITLNGNADHYEGDISGSGKIKAYGFTTRTAEVNVSGSGKSELAVSEQLKVKISGSGKVYYKGSPTVDTNISGSGSVTKAD